MSSSKKNLRLERKLRARLARPGQAGTIFLTETYMAEGMALCLYGVDTIPHADLFGRMNFHVLPGILFEGVSVEDVSPVFQGMGDTILPPKALPHRYPKIDPAASLWLFSWFQPAVLAPARTEQLLKEGVLTRHSLVAIEYSYWEIRNNWIQNAPVEEHLPALLEFRELVKGIWRTYQRDVLLSPE